MKKATSDLINIPGFEPLEPSNATSDDTDWEIDQLLSQVSGSAIVCLQIAYILEPREPPEPSLPDPTSKWV